MPNTSYGFLLFNLGCRYPFLLLGKMLLGGHLNFNYRVVLGMGEMEDDQKWFGPSSAGKINLLLGLNMSFMKIIAQMEDVYTRYFYAFLETPQVSFPLIPRIPIAMIILGATFPLTQCLSF